MSDRELTEFAAKAAGICGTWDERGQCLIIASIGMSWEHWRPLLDDGDAFRLAVLLEMPVHPGRVWKSFRTGIDDDFREVSVFPEVTGDITSIRRAIVEVAAEIGRTMK
ncbi:hypothetical protein ACRCOS_01130 [Pseudomonas aeruginosa]